MEAKNLKHVKRILVNIESHLNTSMDQYTGETPTSIKVAIR